VIDLCTDNCAESDLDSGCTVNDERVEISEYFLHNILTAK